MSNESHRIVEVEKNLSDRQVELQPILPCSLITSLSATLLWLWNKKKTSAKMGIVDTSNVDCFCAVLVGETFGLRVWPGGLMSHSVA